MKNILKFIYIMYLVILLLIIIIIIFYSYSLLSIILYFIYQDNDSTTNVNNLRDYIDKNLTTQEKTYLTNIETKLNFSIINVALDPNNFMKKNSNDITQIVNYIKNDNTLSDEQKKEYIDNYTTSILFMRKTLLDQCINELSNEDKKILDKILTDETKGIRNMGPYIISESIITLSMSSNFKIYNNISDSIIGMLTNLGNLIKKNNMQPYIRR